MKVRQITLDFLPAFGSLRELHYQVSLSRRLGSLPNKDFSMIEPEIIETEKVLNGLIKALRKT